MLRTPTTHLSTITLPSGGILTFPTASSLETSLTNSKHKTFINLPPGCSFDSSLHWHESVTEYFQVHRGVMSLVLENSVGVLEQLYIGASSGTVEIPPFRRHRLRRGDHTLCYEPSLSGRKFLEGGDISREEWDQEVEAEEWTSAADGRKESFFRNISGIVSETRRGGLWEKISISWRIAVVEREFDNWPAVFGGEMMGIEWVWIHVWFWVLSLLGGVMGLKGWYEEYTPVALRMDLQGAGNSKKE